MVFLFYITWTVPLRACFALDVDIGSGEWVLDTFVDLYFITDLCLNLTTSYYDVNGIRVHTAPLPAPTAAAPCLSAPADGCPCSLVVAGRRRPALGRSSRGT